MEKVGTCAPKNARPGMLLGSSSPVLAESGSLVHIRAGLNATAPCGVRYIKTDFGRFVHKSPKIAMVWHANGSIQVGLTEIPWNWRSRCGPWWFDADDERGAYLQAARFQRDLDKEGRAVWEKRERDRILRLREARARI